MIGTPRHDGHHSRSRPGSRRRQGDGAAHVPGRRGDALRGARLGRADAAIGHDLGDVRPLRALLRVRRAVQHARPGGPSGGEDPNDHPGDEVRPDDRRTPDFAYKVVALVPEQPRLRVPPRLVRRRAPSTCGRRRPTATSSSSRSSPTGHAGLALHLVSGPKLTDVLSRYTGLTGRPPLPPPWAFGPWISSDAWRNGGEVRYVVEKFLERKHPRLGVRLRLALGVRLQRLHLQHQGRSPGPTRRRSSGFRQVRGPAGAADFDFERLQVARRDDGVLPDQRPQGRLLDDPLHERRIQPRREGGRGGLR